MPTPAEALEKLLFKVGAFHIPGYRMQAEIASRWDPLEAIGWSSTPIDLPEVKGDSFSGYWSQYTLISFSFLATLPSLACAILVSQSGIEPGPWQWNCWILTTRPPGKLPPYSSFNWVILLLLSCRSSLCILDINSLSCIWFENIFSCSIGCLYTWLIVSFDAEKF